MGCWIQDLSSARLYCYRCAPISHSVVCSRGGGEFYLDTRSLTSMSADASGKPAWTRRASPRRCNRHLLAGARPRAAHLCLRQQEQCQIASWLHWSSDAAFHLLPRDQGAVCKYTSKACIGTLLYCMRYPKCIIAYTLTRGHVWRSFLRMSAKTPEFRCT